MVEMKPSGLLRLCDISIFQNIKLLLINAWQRLSNSIEQDLFKSIYLYVGWGAIHMHVMVCVWKTVCGSWLISFTMWHGGELLHLPYA